MLFSFGYNEAFSLVVDQLIGIIKVGWECTVHTHTHTHTHIIKRNIINEG